MSYAADNQADKQTNKQTNRRSQTSYPHRPTQSMWVGCSMNSSHLLLRITMPTTWTTFQGGVCRSSATPSVTALCFTYIHYSRAGAVQVSTQRSAASRVAHASSRTCAFRTQTVIDAGMLTQDAVWLDDLVAWYLTNNSRRTLNKSLSSCAVDTANSTRRDG